MCHKKCKSFPPKSHPWRLASKKSGIEKEYYTSHSPAGKIDLEGKFSIAESLPLLCTTQQLWRPAYIYTNGRI